MDEPLVSVIIPVRDINPYVLENVSQILAGTYRDFEILIITDNAVSNIKLRKTKVIPSGPTGPAQKRDLGAEKAIGSILAFIDDDAYPSEQWLTEIVRTFGEKNVAAVGGPGVTPPGVGWREAVSGWVSASPVGAGPYTYRFLPQKQRDVDDYPSMNLSVRKKDFWAVGGFDSTYYPGEDTKLSLDIVHKLRRRIIYYPNAVVYHHRRPVLLPFLKQHGNYGVHRGYFARVLPKTSFRLTYFLPSLFDVYLMSLIVLSHSGTVFMIPLIAYGFILAINAVWIAYRSESIIQGITSIPIIAIMHLWYGIRFIQGFFFTAKLNR